MKNKGNILAALMMAMVVGAGPVTAGANAMPMPGEFYYRGKTKTWMDKRFHTIMRQQQDFSCGSAALASLLTFHYRRPVNERMVIESMYRYGDKEKIRKEGFSLLDMKTYLQSMGLRANGYKEPLDKLSQVGIPAIVLINKKGYMHFVVVQGLTKDKVLLGDPALGRKVMKRKDFEKIWENKILFVIDDEVKVARQSFNTEYVWDSRQIRDYSMPIPNSNLANVTLFTSYSPNTFSGGN